jgi:hypothetical protein
MGAALAFCGTLTAMGRRRLPSLKQVPDSEVARLAKKHGPESIASKVLAELRAQRAKDRQVFAFRYGPYWITGLVEDVHTNADLIERADKEE